MAAPVTKETWRPTASGGRGSQVKANAEHSSVLAERGFARSDPRSGLGLYGRDRRWRRGAAIYGDAFDGGPAAAATGR